MTCPTDPTVIDAVWDWLQRPGLDSARLWMGAGEVRLEGVAVAAMSTVAQRFTYELILDTAWRVTDARVALTDAHGERHVQLTRRESGWTVDGFPRPDLAGCIDIDIMGTPSTNTLPIRRLPWLAGQARELEMAYVRLPDLAVMRVRQRYRCLNGAGSVRRFEYLGVATGFQAEIEVDPNGLVLAYPPSWRRLR